MTLAQEIQGRQTRNAKVKALFVSKPAKWISVKELARVAGFASWRTRVSEVRQHFEDTDSGTIQWNGNVFDSRYRYLIHKPIGPDAAVPRERKLF